MDETSEPSELYRTATEIAGMQAIQLQRLEDMLQDPQLTDLRQRRPNHPAVKAWDLLHEQVQGGGSASWPNEFEVAQAVCKLALDLSSWAPSPPYDDFWSFLDGETRAWTVEMLRAAAQYEDVLAELYVWGCLCRHGLDARRRNRENETDIVVGADGRPYPCEVKRIHHETRLARVGEVLKKANRQIKASESDGVGTAFLSIGRAERRAAFDDRIPNDISPYLDATREHLRRGQLRSVAHAVVMWDDFFSLGAFPDPVFYAFRRRYVVIDHPEPRAAPPYSGDDFEVGRTSTTSFRWSASHAAGPAAAASRPATDAVTSGDVLVTEQFRSENEFSDGVRPEHAVEALAEPDSIAGFKAGDIEVYFATRRVELGQSPYTLLIFAVQRPGARLEVVGGFRLYRPAADGDDLRHDPMRAFDELLNRYGREVRAGGQRGVLIPAATSPPGSDIQVVDNGSSMLSAFSKRRPDGVTEHSWVFALDTTAYREATRRHAS